MPLEFGPPPGGNVQGFQIAPVQTADPLQTLAQMNQLRNQNLQQQNITQEMQQRQTQLDSNQAMMQAMADGNGKYDDTHDLMVKSGKVLPQDLQAFETHAQAIRLNAAQQKKVDFENLSNDRETYATKIAQATSQEDIDKTNQWAETNNISTDIPRVNQWTDPLTNKAHAHSILLLNQQEQLAHEEAETAGLTATAATQKAQAARLETENAFQQRTLGLQDVMAAQTDKDGRPLPAAWSAIRAKYPSLNLPDVPLDKQGIAQLIRSQIIPDKLPEYDLMVIKANMGMLGNSDLDQYMARYAVGKGKTLPQLTMDEYNAGLRTAQDAGVVAPTEVNLALRAASGDKQAQVALNRLDQSRIASRMIMYPGVSVTGGAGGAGGGAGGTPAAELHGEEYLKTLPAPFAAEIRSIARGDKLGPTGKAAQSPAGMQTTYALRQYDPDYNPLLAQERKETLHEFDNTSIQHAGGQVLALNTLIHHANLYQEVAEALNNGTWRPGNALYNEVATMFGKAPPLEANLVGRFLAGETGKVATGGVPAEGEINGILANLGTSASPEQIRKAGNDILRIAAGRMVPLKERVDKAKLGNLVDVLGPDARNILVKRGFDPNTMQPTGTGNTGGQNLPQGNGRALDQGTAQLFYNAAGKDPVKARQLATQNGWKTP